MAVYEVELEDGSIFDVEVEGEAAITPEALEQALLPHLAAMRQAPFPARADTPPPSLTPVAQGVQAPPPPSQIDTAPTSLIPIAQGVQAPLYPNVRTRQQPPQFRFLGEPERVEPAVSPTLRDYPAQVAGIPAPQVTAPGVSPGATAPPPGRTLATQPPTAPLQAEALAPEQASLPEKAALSVASGTGGTLRGVGSALRWLGASQTGQALSETGAATQARYQVPHKADLGWRSLLDPEYYAVNWAENLPTSLALLPVAVIGAYAGGATAGVAGLGWFGRTILSSLFGGALSRVAESTLEAGQRYEEARAQGLPEEEANRQANTVFGQNLGLAGLDAIQLAIALYPGARGRFLAQEIRKGGQAAQAAVASLHQSLQQAGPGAVRRVLQGAGLLTAEAVIEGGEEVTQLGIQRGAAQQPTPGINPFAWDAETQEAFRQGALTGVAMGLGAKAFQSITRRAIDTLPPQLTATYATLVEQGQRQGLPSEQAQLRALDAISRTPEGQAHVAAVAQSAVTNPPAESPAVPSPPETPAPPQVPVPPDIEQSPQATVMPQAPVPIPQTKPPVPPEAAAPAREPAFVPAPPTPASRRVERFRPLIDAAATRYGLDPALLAGLIEVESGGNPDIVSPAGAKGLGQLIDSTAKSLGVTNPFDPSQNVEGAARYLAQQLQAFGGDLRLALAAYNAGPGAVRQHKGIPPFPETQRYVPAVLAAAGRYGAAIPGEAIVPGGQDTATAEAEAAQLTAQQDAQLTAQQDAQLAQEEALLNQEQALLDAEANAPAFDLLRAEDVALPEPDSAPGVPQGAAQATTAGLTAPAGAASQPGAPSQSAIESLGPERAAYLAERGLQVGDQVIGPSDGGVPITGTIVPHRGTLAVRKPDGTLAAFFTNRIEWQKVEASTAPTQPAPVAASEPSQTPASSETPVPPAPPAPAAPGLPVEAPPQPEAGTPEAVSSPESPAAPPSPPTTFAPGDRVQYLSNRGDRLTGTVESIGHANGSIEVNVDQTRTIGGRVRIGRVDYVQPGFLTKIDAPEGQASEDATETSTPPAVDPALTVPAIDPETPPPGQQRQLAERMALALQTGELPTNITGLQTLANEIYGGTRAEGAYSPKDLYDALELAVNLLILRQGIAPTGTLAEAEATLQQLEALLHRLPTQTVRTQEQIDFQQFSTPPTYAFVANWAANIQPTDIVLEPSAGTGSLAVFAANVVTQAQVLANEVAPRRLEALQALGFTPTSDDALFLHSLFTHHGRQRPSVVVMNPPFSAAALQNRGGTRNRDSRNRGGVAKRDLLVGATHIEEALKLLQPGGRLVAIVGEGMAMEAPTFKTWWRKIQRQYTVRANLHITKDVYGKYGTAFGTRLLVIDNTGPQGSVEVLAPRDAPGDARAYLPLDQALTLLERIRDGRTLSTPSTEPTRPSLAPNGGPVPESVPGPSVAPDAVGPGEPGTRPGTAPDPTGLPAGPGGDQPQRPAARPSPVRQSQRSRTDRGPTTGPAQPGQPAAPRSSDTPVEPVARPYESTVGASSGGISPSITPEGVEVEVAPIAPTEVANPQAVDDISDSVFEPYSTAHIPLKGAQPHKGKLVQSAAMSAVPPATITYTPHIPRDLVTSGRLSAAQLEAVIYAGQAHQVLLDSPKELADKGIQKIRKGYFIGDGTGVGKGRQLAGIILDNWRQGRTKAVWISEKQKLFDDARRDWSGIGQDAKQVFKLPGHYNAIPQGKGILFTTYDTLKGKNKDGTRTRVQQLVDWLGADYDGVIAFDESHALANNTDTKGNRGTQQASAKALAGIALQQALPNARVIYVSATGATEVRNLGYVERLGLWGPGTDFPTKRDFITEVSAGGVGVMELVARDMKALGVYQARSLSYDDVRYERLEHALADEQVLTYNTLAQAWQSVLKDIDAALAAAGGADANGKVDGRLRAGRLSQFWGEHQRFFNQILTALTMPSVIQAMDADLARGDAVVVQLTNTNAAGLDRKLAAMEEGEELEDLSLTPLETLITYVEKSFPTTQIVEVADEEGNIKKVPLVVNDVPVENPEAVAIKNRLLDHLASLYTSVPDSPLDMLINHFGTDQVAEITGRTQRLAWTLDDDGQRVRVLQRRTERQIQQEADQFMADQRRILVFSEKGGTGRSYHADLDSANQRPRRHYVVQAGWRADKAMQGLGRTHRTNQASAPTYILVTTDLPGHKRFVSSIARRLNQLGALTRGQRQTTTQGLFSERDNLESALAEQALAMLVRDLVQGRIPEVSLDEFQEQSGIRLVNDQGEAYKEANVDIPQFLNRLLSMTTDMQQRVFEAFSERLDIALERAIQDNTLDVGMETLRADRIETVQEQIIAHDDATGADTSLVTLKLLHKRNPTTWAMLQKTLGGAAERRDGIGTLEAYARNTTSGRVYAFLKAFPRTESASGLVIPQLNRVGPAGRELIDRSDVSRTTYTPVPPEEAQRLWDAEIGKLSPFREQTMHLMTGVLLPHWSKLRGTAARVYRVQTVDGHRYLGRTITQRELAGVLKNFGVDTSGQSTAPVLSPTQAVEAVLGQGGTLYLSNGWRLGVAITGGERRIEIHGPTYTHGQQLISQGVLFERMGPRGRYFIPTDATKGPEIMRRILEQAPIVEMQFPKGAQWQETKDAMALRASQGDTRAQAIQDIMTRPREAIEASAQAADIPAQAPAYLASRHAIVRRLEQLHADMGSIPGRRRFAVGKLRGQRRGEFAVRSETIRTKLAHDLEVLAHEVGHHILKYLFHDTGALLSQTSRGPRLSGQEPIAQLLQAHRDELTALASPGDSPLREGFAEFLRLYLTNPTLASQEAAGFFAAFEQFVQETEPGLAAELQGIQRDYTVWSEQPGIHRLLGLIDYDAGRWSLPTWAGVETFFHQLYAFVAHRNHPLSRLVSEAERQLGQQPSFTQRLLHGTGRQEPVVSAEEDPSILAAVLRGASGFGDAFVTQGQLDYRSGDFLPNAPSLREVLAPLVGPRRDDTQLWEAYMLGRRALELGQRRSRLDVSPGARARAERAYQLFLRQSGMTTTVLEQTVQAAEQAYPVFAQVHDAFQHWNQGLLTYLRDSGSLSAEAYDAIVDMNQSYVPWHRVMDEGNWLSKVTGGPGRSAANVPDAVKTLRGSLRPYAPPIESAMRQAYHITRIAARQAVGRAAVDLTARLEGGGLFAVRVPAAQRVTNTSVRELQTQLARAGIDVPADAVDELLQVWRPDVWRLGKNEVTIVRDGQREVWEIRDPELYRTLLDLDRVTLQPFTRLLIAPLAFLTQVKRFSVTASPTFWLKNALFRDQATLTAQTGQAPFIGFFKNLWQAVGQGPRYQEWAANGGLLSSFADLSYPALEKRRRELLHGKYPRTHDGIVYVLKHPWEVLRLAYELSHDALNVSENATRLGIYEEAIRHPFLVDTTGRAQKLRAAAAARDGIIDFGRVGSGIQGLRLITFALGPAIGGADKMVRTLIRYPRRSAILLATMMLGSLLIRYLNEDDTPRFLNEGTGAPEARRDIYRRLPQWLRDISHIFITRKADGTPRIWAIPKTFDWGFLGHTLFERAVLDPWFNNPAQARGTLRNISTAASRQLGVNVIPDVALTYLENTYNWSSFRERPIVSRYLEGVMEAYRYDPSTSETARQLGPILGVAPVKIDNTLRQGYLAQFGLQLSDRALSAFLGRTGPTLPAKRLEEYPAMGAFLSRYPSLGAEPLQLYREAAKAIDEKKKTLKMMQQGGDPRVDTLWSDPKTQTEAAWAPWFDAMDKHHAALYAAMRAVRVDTAMSPEAKRHRLDTLTLGLIAATERFMELYRSWETASLEGRQRQGKAIEQHLQGLRTGTRER